MPWREVSIMSQRQEFVTLAQQEGANIRQLCRQFGISPRTAYKWLHRYRREGLGGLADRPRRPHHAPRRTPPAVEAAVVTLRQAHPTWGGRKLRQRLQDRGVTPLPPPSTITAILRRQALLPPKAATPPRAWQRFEAPGPNHLWQMDFKGHFATAEGRCHPLTVLDDHSRFCVGLVACPNERGETVQPQLITLFRRYGLPARLLVDNGAPWGSDADHRLTPLTVWLLHLGVAVVHSRPYHPQTGGKDERFHRTLKADVLRDRSFTDLAACQREFDAWRDVYNLERPHDALALAVPASRYQVSPCPYPETLPPLEYGPDDLVRKVQSNGEITVHGRTYRLATALRGYPVALRPTAQDQLREVYFGHHKVAELNLTQPVDG